MLKELEKSIGSLKFAVSSISLFCIYMIIGTFIESYYGTSFANRIVYKSLPFMMLQGALFLSIFCATTLRLPFRKKLTGFYIIHAGLMTIFVGSFITFVAGIDGQLTLDPGATVRQVLLQEDQLFIQNMDEDQTKTVDLPSSAFTQKVGESVDGIKVLNYLPFADKKLHWSAATTLKTKFPSSEYFISNGKIEQKFALSLHPESNVEKSLKLGPLSVQYYPAFMQKCFGEGVRFWDSALKKCFLEKELGAKFSKSSDHQKVTVSYQGSEFNFFPKLSTYPFKSGLELNRNSPLRIFNSDLFKGHKILFLFGETAIFEKAGKWFTTSLSTGAVTLPWMNFHLTLKKHSEEILPRLLPEYILPIQKDGKLIKGDLKAVEVEINQKKFWVTSEGPVNLLVNGKKYLLAIGSKSFNLPFAFSLDQFKMDKNPGTNMPASFESFVNLFTGQNPTKHHIYMNNPLKFSKYTFYQSSYFQTEGGGYGSVLSVNFDPGRWLKYLGSLMLTLGSILYYFMKMRKPKKLLYKNNLNQELLVQT